MYKYVMLLFIIMFVPLFIQLSAAQPLVITFVDRIDYNVTYNATDEAEYPPDTGPSEAYLPQIIGNIYIENYAEEDLSDINITLNNTENLVSLPEFRPELSDVYAKVHNVSWNSADTGGIIVIHIPDLPKNGRVVLNYTVDPSEVLEPVNITKNVTTRLGAGRVFNNENFNVTIKVQNRMFSDTVIYLNLTERTLNNFTINNDTGFVSWSEGYNSTISEFNTTFVWSGVVLNGNGDYAYLNLEFHSPNSTTVVSSEAASYNEKKNYVLLHFGYAELNFTANDTVWNVTVPRVEMRPKAVLTVTKSRTGDYNWTIQPQFKNPTPDLYYEVRRVSVWAIPSINIASDLDPGNRSNWMPNSYYQWNTTTWPEKFDGVNNIIGPGGVWHNGTDGTNMEHGHTFFNDTLVPIVWGKVNFTVVDNSSMIGRRFYSVNRTNNYVYYQKIVFLYGYFLEAVKTVEDMNGQGMFKVTIELTNKGVGVTPNSTLLADIIPQNMAITTSTGGGGDEGIEINSTDTSKDYTLQGFEKGILWAKYGGIYNFTGKAAATGEFQGAQTYFWELKPLVPGEKITIVYYINGTGDYYPGEMYVVGVDPVQTNRIAASPKISTADGFKLPKETAEKYAVPLSLSIFALSMFSYRKRR